jgi:hypothetical protein
MFYVDLDNFTVHKNCSAGINPQGEPRLTATVKVKGSSESRPSIMIGDKVRLRVSDVWNQDKIEELKTKRNKGGTRARKRDIYNFWKEFENNFNATKCVEIEAVVLR